MVGDGTDRSRLEQLTAELSITDRVNFVGVVSNDELLEHFVSCDVFVMPSTQEGFGIVFAEAMACSKPVIAAKSRAIPEVVSDGETGMLVDPERPEELQAALLALLSDPDQRKRFGRAGRARVESSFTCARFGERVELIARELMA